jgi:CubicO group peptidase (beta-lactamase class C family)
MKFYASLLPALPLLLGGCFAPPKLELPAKASSMAELEPYLERAVARNAPPGMTVAVIRGEETRYLKSFGLADGPKGIPASGQSVYQWWSVTKLFTATAVLQLHEEGKLDLDAPVVRYLPFVRFRGKIASDSAVTVRRLLSHSSGLQDVGMSILGIPQVEAGRLQ